MSTFHQVELLARDHQHQRLQEAEDYRLAKQAARWQRSQIGLKQLALGTVALTIKLGAMAALLFLAILLKTEV